VRGDLDMTRESIGQVELKGCRDRRLGSQGAQRRTQPGLGQDRRVDAARQLARLGQRVAELFARMR
jgi:hypothetical protein